MVKNLYTIFDKVSESYMPPFTEINHGTAIRGLQDMMTQNVNHNLAKFPHDYALYLLGSFDDQSGDVVLQPEPMHVEDIVKVKLTKEEE